MQNDENMIPGIKKLIYLKIFSKRSHDSVPFVGKSSPTLLIPKN
jgi:hypothetical protein